VGQLVVEHLDEMLRIAVEYAVGMRPSIFARARYVGGRRR
jgi:hypothetical protein